VTYYRGLPASTPQQRAAIDALFAERARLDAEYKRALAVWTSGAVQLALWDVWAIDNVYGVDE
jgi:hypothetical protein